MGDHPVNVAVCGDYLEKLHFKRDFLNFNGNTLLELFVSPCDFLPPVNFPVIRTMGWAGEAKIAYLDQWVGCG